MTSLPAVLDLLDLAIARADGVVPDDIGDEHAAIARRLRVRSGFVGDALVTAVAGGTGCGKSSIVNALAGATAVTTGIVRPTTERAVAVSSEAPYVDLAPLLDILDVADRIDAPDMGPMVLIDLPDFDSTQLRHRQVVEAMLPRVDAVIWVLDPEKYADPVLHADFLSGLTDHTGQFVFALNQVDRLGDDASIAVEALERILDLDGLAGAPVVPTVAEPSVGIDIGALRAELDRRWDVKSTALRAMALDVRRVAATGWTAAGTAVDRGVDADDAALARATFVSLGVAAFELHHRLSGAIA